LAKHFFVRRAGTVLLCGALAALGACGGDDGDDDDDDVSTDAGNDAGSPSDSGSPADSGSTPDSGAVTDSGSPDAAAALDRTGIQASAARAGIVFPLACKNGVACKTEDNETECATDTRASYDQGVTKGFTDVCLDATLDFWSCLATAACANFDSECGPLYQTQLSICPKADGGT
jgi:hypothetical protein